MRLVYVRIKINDEDITLALPGSSSGPCALSSVTPLELHTSYPRERSVQLWDILGRSGISLDGRGTAVLSGPVLV